MSVALFRGGPVDGKRLLFPEKPPAEYVTLCWAFYLRIEYRCYVPGCRHAGHPRWQYLHVEGA